MYLKIVNNDVQHYPYSIQKLKLENKNVSFPKNLESDLTTLASFGVYKVFPTAKPTVDYKTEKVQETTPAFINDKWQQQWNIISLTEEEKQSLTNSKSEEIRQQRNYMLIQCDWTQYKDISEEISTKWQPYRQALRDITQQPGFPWDINWPTQPE